jgi:parallel beta-helix repeat protein
VNQAAPGDHILVSSGVFTDLTRTASQVVLVNKSLTFEGGYTTDFTSRDPESSPTIVDGEGVRRGFTISGDWMILPTVSIDGFHIRNGYGDSYGGGLYIAYATVALTNVQVYRNTGGNGWGSGGGLYVTYANVTLTNVKVYENTASTTGYGYGGGLYAENCQLSIYASQFTTNTASTNSGGQGGGLYLYNTSGEVASSIFRANIAAGNTTGGNNGYGGGIYAYGYYGLAFQDNEISNNTANNGDTGEGYGGGFYIWGSYYRLERNRITANRSGGSWGGGGGLYLYQLSNALLNANYIQNNTANGNGGGLYLYWASNTVLNGNYIQDNVANGSGGGFYISIGSPSLTNNIVAKNRAGNYGAGGYIYSEYDQVSLIHTTLVGNTGGDGSAIHVGGGWFGGSVVLTNTIIATHTVGIANEYTLVSLEATLWDNVETYIQGLVASTGAISITGQARFVDDAYHIAANSDALDRGVDAGVGTDVDGDFRPSGDGFDIGADEYLFPVSMALLPDRQQAWAEAGQVVTFSHILRNTGANADTYTLTASIRSEPPAEWTLDWSPGPLISLEPGQQATVWLTVTVPSGASLNDWSLVNLTATSSISPTQVWRTVTDTVIVNAPATRYVATTGSDTRGEIASVCADPSSPCRTLQHAANVAFAGDEIRVAGGVYTGTGDAVVNVGKSLTVQGGYTTTFTERDPEAWPTVVDGEGARRGIYINGSFSVVLDGIHVTRGDAGNAGSSPGYGGGIYASGATLTLNDMQVYSNTASSTGWGYGGGLYAANATVNIHDSAFHNNIASSGWGSGGGLYLGSCRNSVISRNTIRDNRASSWSDGYGGGMYISGGSRIVVRDNQFIRNVATQSGWSGSGGGLYVGWSSSTLLEENAFLSNTTNLSGTLGYGGGLYVYESGLTVRRNIFQGNTASVEGDGYGGAIVLRDVSDAQIEANTVVSNTASGAAYRTGRGGGIWAVGGSQRVTLDNNIIAANRAGGSDEGGGVCLDGVSAFSFRYTTLADNGSSGVYLAGSSAQFVNTIIAGHSTVGITVTESSQASLDYTLWHNNGSDSGGPGTIIRTNDLTGAPEFVDPAGLDYHIGASSSARDRAPCIEEISTDIDGDLRPTGDACDVGADEYPWLFRLEPDRSGEVRPGETIFYTHWLTNAGGRLDTYSLNSSLPGAGWMVEVIPSSIPVPAGYAAPVVVAVSAPSAVVSGTQVAAVITATSQGSGLAASVTDTTTVIYQPGAPALSPTLQQQDALPLATVQFLHMLTNRSNGAETFTVTASILTDGWEAPEVTPSTVTVPPYGSAAVTVTVQVPAGALSGTLGMVLVRATAWSDPALYDESVDTVRVLMKPGVALAPDREGVVEPGGSVAYTHILTNTGNGPDTFALTAGGLPAGWTVTVEPASVALAAGASASVVVTVQAPSDALSGTVSTAVVTATSSADPAVFATVRDTTTVLLKPGVALAPDREGVVEPGGSVTYTHILTNTGNGPDTFVLTARGLPAGWTVTVEPASVVLAVGASASVVVTVQAPSDALSGTVATAVVTATSSADPAVFATVRDTTTVRVTGYSVYLPLVVRNYPP